MVPIRCLLNSLGPDERGVPICDLRFEMGCKLRDTGFGMDARERDIAPILASRTPQPVNKDLATGNT